MLGRADVAHFDDSGELCGNARCERRRAHRLCATNRTQGTVP